VAKKAPRTKRGKGWSQRMGREKIAGLALRIIKRKEIGSPIFF